MKAEISIIVGVLGFAISVATFFIGRTSAARKAGREDGAVVSRLDSIAEKVGRIDKSIDYMNSQLGEQRDRITRVETKMMIYHGGSHD